MPAAARPSAERPPHTLPLPNRPCAQAAGNRTALYLAHVPGSSLGSRTLSQGPAGQPTGPSDRHQPGPAKESAPSVTREWQRTPAVPVHDQRARLRWPAAVDYTKSPAIAIEKLEDIADALSNPRRRAGHQWLMEQMVNTAFIHASVLSKAQGSQYKYLNSVVHTIATTICKDHMPRMIAKASPEDVADLAHSLSGFRNTVNFTDGRGRQSSSSVDGAQLLAALVAKASEHMDELNVYGISTLPMCLAWLHPKVQYSAPAHFKTALMTRGQKVRPECRAVRGMLCRFARHAIATPTT